MANQWTGVDPAIRFWPKVVAGPNGCWIWTGSKTDEGYGRFNVGGRNSTVGAHRWAWRQVHGEIPDGLELDHLCRTPSCVRPDHLEPVTRQENCQRSAVIKTHCPQGHPYTDENTVRRPEGWRHCRICRRDECRRRRRKKKELQRGA